jgi:hypothetical protein
MERWTDLAARQHALLSVEQARRWMSQAAIDKRVVRGALERPRRGVLRVPGSPDTWEQRQMAAVLAAGAGAVASRWSAAAAWGLDVRRPHEPIVTVPMRSPERRCRLQGVEVHETTTTGGIHVGVVGGIPVTSVGRTLCDLTACASPRFVAKRVDEALRRSLVDLPVLRAVFDDLTTRGRRRSTVMREILERRTEGYVPATTDLEVELDEILVAQGLPRPVPQHPVWTPRMTYRVDFVYPDHRIALEADGFGPHAGRLAFDEDRERQNDIVTVGWTVLRYTSGTSPERFGASVRRARERAERADRADRHDRTA